MRRELIVSVVAMWIVLHGAQAQVEITSFDKNGEITWSAPSNSVCTIQWRGDLQSSTNWQDHWAYLDGLVMTNGTRVAEVPMFYRVVCWTNSHLVPMPVGRASSFSVSNALGETWAMTSTVHGILVLPGSQPEKRRLVRFVESYSGAEPEGYAGEWTDFVRSTETAYYSWQGPFDSLVWQDAPIGTVWTNTTLGSQGAQTYIRTIVTNESITVPAGTFDCIKIHVDHTTSGNPIPEWYNWISPGGGAARTENYNIPNTNAAPVVYELESWTDI
ncbi:MAG: hypothetical protein ISS31_10885 [Kiritimatiellae bacterium]|nr:hypothetical protein [Kiritimatiellia bacterium]